MLAGERENQREPQTAEFCDRTHLLDPAIVLSTHRPRMHASLVESCSSRMAAGESRSWTAVGARWRRPWPGRCRRVRHSLGSRAATISPESARQPTSSQALPRPDLTPRRRTSASCARRVKSVMKRTVDRYKNVGRKKVFRFDTVPVPVPVPDKPSWKTPLNLIDFCIFHYYSTWGI